MHLLRTLLECIEEHYRRPVMRIPNPHYRNVEIPVHNVSEERLPSNSTERHSREFSGI
jgi:hypothetical protein